MEPKQNRSIGLIIRRFFAIFILFSTASGIAAQIETGTLTNETFGSAFVSLLIAYYLARSPRNKTQSSDLGVESNSDELGDEVPMGELLEEFDNAESFKEVATKAIGTPVNLKFREITTFENMTILGDVSDEMKENLSAMGPEFRTFKAGLN